jgi:hypothetical protein
MKLAAMQMRARGPDATHNDGQETGSHEELPIGSERGRGCAIGPGRAKRCANALPQYQDVDLHANHPSSSSRRVGAGRGAPGFVSAMGSRT